MPDHPLAATINRHCLIDALDNLADVAAAIERHADHDVPLDHDHFISMVREVIYDLAMEVEASDLLS